MTVGPAARLRNLRQYREPIRGGLKTGRTTVAIMASGPGRAAGAHGFTLVGTAGSRRVLEKSGLTYERTFEHTGLPHVLYRIRADRWAAS